ncbi:MAG: SIR2 family protein [Bryobacteraceae bacterium]
MSINTVVLLGAGFSRNWGAPLASEVASSLLQQVGDDHYLRKLLTKHEKNFEDALSEIQQACISTPPLAARERLDKLQAAIGAMFDNVNTALERQRFEFSQEKRLLVSQFLARFDAIFGLNQDLLLELHYLTENVMLADSRHPRWDGFQMPGIVQVSNSYSADRRRRRSTPAPPPFTVAPRLQPYFKMHGSSNWYTNDGRNLLVMGRNKDLVIGESDLLRWYYGQFRGYLSRPDTRLMVIGYSFSDQHINDAIAGASKSGGLKGMFLVNPNGRAVLGNSKRSLPESMHNDLEDIDCLGGSTRPISETFAGDEFEHQKFIEFFQPAQQV